MPVFAPCGVGVGKFCMDIVALRMCVGVGVRPALFRLRVLAVPVSERDTELRDADGVGVVILLPYGESDDVSVAARVALDDFVDDGVTETIFTTASELYGTSQMFLPSNTPPLNARRSRFRFALLGNAGHE